MDKPRGSPCWSWHHYIYEGEYIILFLHKRFNSILARYVLHGISPTLPELSTSSLLSARIKCAGTHLSILHLDRMQRTNTGSSRHSLLADVFQTQVFTIYCLFRVALACISLSLSLYNIVFYAHYCVGTTIGCLFVWNTRHHLLCLIAPIKTMIALQLII